MKKFFATVMACLVVVLTAQVEAAEIVTSSRRAFVGGIAVKLI